MGKRCTSKALSIKLLNVYTEAIIGTLDFLAFGLAFSGKLNVGASRLCFLLALAVIIYRLYCNLPPHKFPVAFWGGSTIMTLGALALMWWVQPELIPQYSGTLSPKNGFLFSPHEKNLLPTLEIGTSCRRFTYTGPKEKPIFELFADSSLTIEALYGYLKVSTIIRDKSGKVVAKLNRNEWEVSPEGTWDLNYTDEALEVIDARDSVVLQVRILPDRIQLQGEWWNDKGQGLRLVQGPSWMPGALIAPLPKSPKVLFLPEIERIFEYPSKTYLGKLRTPHILPSSCPP